VGGVVVGRIGAGAEVAEVTGAAAEEEPGAADAGRSWAWECRAVAGPEAEALTGGGASGRAGTVGTTGSATKRGGPVRAVRPVWKATRPVTSRTAAAAQATIAVRRRPGGTGPAGRPGSGTAAVAAARKAAGSGVVPEPVSRYGGTQPPTRSSAVRD
jgi:hypothetical protein